MLGGVVVDYASGVLFAIFEEGIAGRPTLVHARLRVEGVEMSKGRGVSCQFKIPTSPIKSRTRYNAFKATSKTHLFFPAMSTTIIISLGMLSFLLM